mmetsp:Transcript_65857/g.208423  ORF Transcript_65857/g.208423 Transcript_65857/m.208423 type:complete len:240 (-) Transcript_65857:23-742(-)
MRRPLVCITCFRMCTMFWVSATSCRVLIDSSSSSSPSIPGRECSSPSSSDLNSRGRSGITNSMSMHCSALRMHRYSLRSDTTDSRRVSLCRALAFSAASFPTPGGGGSGDDTPDDAAGCLVSSGRDLHPPERRPGLAGEPHPDGLSNPAKSSLSSTPAMALPAPRAEQTARKALHDRLDPPHSPLAGQWGRARGCPALPAPRPTNGDALAPPGGCRGSNERPRDGPAAPDARHARELAA